MKKFTIIILALLAALQSFAFDNELSSVAVKPGTNEAYIAGTFTTIIVFDLETGKTLRTFEVPNEVIKLQFNPDGNVLIAASKAECYLINPLDGTIISTIKGNVFYLAPQSPYFVDLRQYGDTKAMLYNSTTGEKVKELRTDFQPKACGFDKDFKKLYVLSAKIEIGADKEKEILAKKLEKSTGYNCYNSAYTAKQEDKNGSLIAVFDLPDGNLTETITCAYDFNGSFALAVIPVGKEIFISDWDMLVKIDASGKSHPIECEKAGFAYANAFINDFSQIVISSTKSGNIFNVLSSQWTAYDLKNNFEFTYTASIFFHDNQTWLLSKDYTLASMNKSGEKSKYLKIDNLGDKGVAVYYYNGYSKKEDRDKEAAIINAELSKLGQQNIDLEQFIGKGDVVIANFKTVTEAENFTKTLKDNKLQYITKIAPAK
jgi:WD40 repeat protein